MSNVGHTGITTDSRKGMSKIGFILTAIGAAVGLGNIWGFPSKMVSYGGPAFLIPYVIGVLLLGLPFLILEINLGSRWRRAPISFYNNYFGKAGRSFAWFQAGVQLLIGTYYAVIIGWVMLSIGVSFTDSLGQTGYYAKNILGEVKGITGKTFSSLGKIQPLLFLCFFLTILLTGIIVSLGVDKGIERVNKVIVPALFLLMISIFIYSLSLDGAGKGLDFMFKPDFSKLKEINAWKAAFSQAIFTLSLAVSVIIVYSIHSPKNGDNTNRAITIMSGDTLVAILACVIIGSTLGYAQGNDLVVLTDKSKVYSFEVIKDGVDGFNESVAVGKHIDYKNIDTVQEVLALDSVANKYEHSYIFGGKELANIDGKTFKWKGIADISGGAFVFKMFPVAFKSMNTSVGNGFGNFFAVCFFVAIFFAALSSMISLFEPTVANFDAGHGIKRGKAVWICCLITFVCGVIFTFQGGQKLLDVTDGTYVNFLLLPSLFTMGIAVVWNRNKFKDLLDINNRSSRYKLGMWFRYFLMFSIFVAIAIFAAGVYMSIDGMKKITVFQWLITSWFFIVPLVILVFGFGFSHFWIDLWKKMFNNVEKK